MSAATDVMLVMVECRTCSGSDRDSCDLCWRTVHGGAWSRCPNGHDFDPRTVAVHRDWSATEIPAVRS